MPIKGTVTKVQSYTTGNDCSLSIVSDDKSKVMAYDKEIVHIYTEAEHEEAQKGRNTTLDMIYEKQDAILDLTLIISKVIKDMNEESQKGEIG